MSDNKSSYLKYLPPILWKDEPQTSKFSLGCFLKLYEKILTGIDDEVLLEHKEHKHLNFENVIDDLYKLLNPFKVNSENAAWLEEWLEYLAEWVGLKLLPTWDEYQKRKIIKDAVDIYNLRGLKKGLFKYLEIYLVTETKPRITIDIGESLFRLSLNKGNDGNTNVILSGPPIIHPLSIEIDRTSSSFNGQIIVGDAGAFEDYLIKSKIWRIKAHGELHYQHLSGKVDYMPIYDGRDLDFGDAVHDPRPIVRPIAIVDDPLGFYGIADEGRQAPAAVSKILRLNKYASSSVSLVWRGPPMVKAIDMCLADSGNYMVLDRGNFDTDVSAEGMCQILVINPDANPGGTPSGSIVTQLGIPSIIEPKAVAILDNNNYVIADLGDGKFGAGPGGIYRPTEIYEADKSTGNTTSLLAGIPEEQRPIFPVSLILEDAGHLMILDYGVKTRVGSTALVNSAKIWSLTLPPAAPSLEVISEDISYVYPKDFTLDSEDNLIIADHGEVGIDRDWRVPDNYGEFGVVINFANTSLEALRITRGISNIITKEKPAHTKFTLKR